jgi:hypothetical protein
VLAHFAGMANVLDTGNGMSVERAAADGSLTLCSSWLLEVGKSRWSIRGSGNGWTVWRGRRRNTSRLSGWHRQRKL